MPKLKDAEVLDVKELEDAEYSEGQFEKYTGEVPPTGTMLLLRVAKIWWTYTENDDPMLKVLCVAEDNPGSLEEYDGLPAWENMALTTGAKFKWAPFLEFFDLTIRDVRNKTMVESEDDNIGAPVQKIASFKPGSDDALFVGVISKERYQGKWQAHIKEWLDPDTELEDSEEEQEEEKPRRRAAANGGRRRAGATRSRRTKPEDEPEEEAEEEEEEAPRASRSRTRKAAPAKTSSRRGSRRSSKSDDEDEPPF